MSAELLSLSFERSTDRELAERFCKFLLTRFMTLDPLLRIIMLSRRFLKFSGDSTINNGDGYRSKFGMFANKQSTAYVLTYSQHWRVSAKHWPRSLIQHGI
jgi:hypothetical protein